MVWQLISFLAFGIIAGMYLSSDHPFTKHANYHSKAALPEDAYDSNEVTCGTTNSKEPKIVGGGEARRGEHPWMVGIRIDNDETNAHVCGGTLISPCNVLTAAHCLKYTDGTDIAKSDFLIRLGDHNNKEHEEGEEYFRVESISLHPEYNFQTQNNDIAILQIKCEDRPTINPFVIPACLPKEDWPYQPGLNCTVAGWGKLRSSDSGLQNVLQSAVVPILSEEKCRNPNVYGNKISEGMFCAGFLEGGIDTCQGDSGGPLICKVEGLHTVVGITSWGVGCAAENKTGVYTRVTSYLEWICQQDKGIKCPIQDQKYIPFYVILVLIIIMIIIFSISLLMFLQ